MTGFLGFYQKSEKNRYKHAEIAFLALVNWLRNC